MKAIDRYYIFFLIIILTIYPAIELNRLIILAWQEYGLVRPFWIELAWINLGYIGAMGLVWRLSKGGRDGRTNTGTVG